jgi:uncharacterized protein involved in exopolysaccharide biosynthesis
MNKEEKIDLLLLSSKILKRKKLIIYTTIISFVIGLFVAILSPAKFNSNITFVIQDNQTKNASSSFSGLAAMAGININANSNTSVLSPNVYPNIVSSISFQKDLMNSLISFKGNDISVYEYNQMHLRPSLSESIFNYTVGLPLKVLAKIRQKKTTLENNHKSNFISFSIEEANASTWLSSKIKLEADEESGSITISTEFKDPLIAAQIAQNFFLLLEKYVTKYKINKASQYLEFVQNSYNEKKQEVEIMQSQIASFKDNNKNFTTAESQIQIQRLTSDYNVIYGVYSELAKKLEQCKLHVKENTPIFTIINPVAIPVKKSGPNRIIILLSSIFIGVFLSIMIILAKLLFEDLKEKWLNLNKL